jgi:hypothetical protein
MKKIISLFKRDYEGNRQIYNEVVPGAEWVISGEGVATVKHDGTSCLFQDGKLYKRYDAKKGKTPPAGFIPAQDPDPETGHWPGWLAVGDGPEDRWHREALIFADSLPDGTYELIGPKVQGNPYKNDTHRLIPHGRDAIDAPRTFDELREWFKNNVIEGIVWHHPDGRMVKIKRRDFGYKWPE